MREPVAAAIAFFALGANLLGVVLLLLFNPRNRELRWYAGFQVAIVTWLLAQAMVLARGSWEFWGIPHAIAVSFLPGLFLATALAENPKRPVWQAWLAAAMGLVAAPILILNNRNESATLSALVVGWQVIGWGAGTILMGRRSYAQRTSAGGHWSPMRLALLTALLIPSASMVIAMLADARNFFVYVMPPVTVVIQILIFIGIARMRFYDIEVRVGRSGELAARAAEGERLAVLGELAATIAHEVRNPLTGMRSLTQRIADEDVDPEKRRRYAEVILEEVGRLERIVDNLLGIARRSSRETARSGWDGQPTELAPLFEDLVLLVQSRARAAEVRLVANAGDLHAAAPREALAQALLNLLINAVRHAPARTSIHLLASARNGTTDIVVRDQGAGIPVAAREKIFEPFHSGSDGTGLGLSVVRSLARDLNWGLQVDDAAGGGAQFTLRVPNAGVTPETLLERVPGLPA